VPFSAAADVFVFLPSQVQRIKLHGMRKITVGSIRLTAMVYAVAMSGCVAWAQMGDMPGMQHHHHDANEKLGSVSFPVSCETASKAPMERGIALLHSFGYEEAEEQFTELTKSDPKCAMAHWGVAMSEFHELWGRPDKAAMDKGWAEIQEAQKLGGKTDRERRYISTLSSFYDPAKGDNYQSRVDAYTAGMLALHEAYPADVETSAFYALSLLADVAPDDTSLVKERKALAVLVPLFEKNPDHPGLAHYIIHTCDTPKLAQQGLPAAQKYAQIASSSPHALHMPGHIFARLGMWPEDISSNLASVAASEKAEAAGIPGTHHMYHAQEFLLYAYLQTGQDGKAKQLVDGINPLADRLDAMPGMDDLKDMSGYVRNEFPVFYDLEMRDWNSAATLVPAPHTNGSFALVTYWGRGVADGHLRRAEDAAANLKQFDAGLEEMKKSPYAFLVGQMTVGRDELVAWKEFAEGKNDIALETMRKAADEQDKLGQGEVDIPTREMLGDMLLELKRPKEALVEYKVALTLSPNRLNGLYGAGRAAEALGMKKEADGYYAAMLKNTDDSAHSSRSSLAHAKEFVAGKTVAEN
jgi:tetratricopeptide (TPR) repeat protein